VEDIQIREVIEESGVSDFIQELGEALSVPDLYTLDILGFIPPENNELYILELNQENIARIAEYMGAEELVSRTAVFEIGGRKYMLFVEVANYNGRWYLTEFGGNLAIIIGMPRNLYGLVFLPQENMDSFYDELMENIVTEW
jgi:hypothetical protein